MSTHTEQDVMNRITAMKNQRKAAQNAAIAKGYDSSYFDNDTKKLWDIAEGLLAGFPGYKDAWSNNNIIVTTSPAAMHTVYNRAGNISFNGVDNTSSTSPRSITYSTYEQNVNLTFPASGNLTSAPSCYRLQITLPSGVRKYIWTMVIPS